MKKNNLNLQKFRGIFFYVIIIEIHTLNSQFDQNAQIDKDRKKWVGNNCKEKKYKHDK